MNKRMLFILLVFISLCIGAYFYVNHFFLPVKLKSYIETKASEYIKRKVTFKEIRYDFLQGFTVSDIKIFDNIEPNKIFVEINKASFNPLFLPIIKSKNIIIPSITITSPHILLTKSKDQVWNFNDLKELRPKKTSNSKFKFYLRKITLQKGIVDVIDYSQNNPVQHHIDNFYLSLILSLSKEVKIQVYATEKKSQSKVQFNGKFAFNDKVISGKLDAENIIPHNYIQTFNLPPLPYKQAVVKKASLEIAFQKDIITSTGQLMVDDIFIDTNNITIKTDLNTENINLTFTQGEINLHGNIALTNARVEQNKNTLRADLLADISAFKISKDFLNVQAIIQGSNIIGNLNQNTIKAKTFNATGISLTNTPNSSLITAIITSEGWELKINDNSILTNSTMNNLKAERMLNSWEITTDLNLNPFTLKNKTAEVSCDIRIPTLTLKSDETALNLNTEGSLKQLSIQSTQGLTLSGQPDVKLNFKSQNGISSYLANFSFFDIALGPFEKIGNVEHIKGNLQVQDNLIQTNTLSMDILDNQLNISGLLKDFKNPTVNITANSDNLDLSVVDNLLKTFWKEKSISLTGIASTEISYNGSVLKPDPAAIKGNANLKAVDIFLIKQNKYFSNVSGKIAFENNLISWADLKGTWNDMRYVLTGNLMNLSRPTIETSLRSKNVSLNTKVFMNLKTFDILKLKGRIFNSDVDLQGKAGYKDILNQNIDLKGVVDLNLTDLALLPSLKDIIQKIPTSSLLRIEGIFSGKPTNILTWNINITGRSEYMEFKEYKLDNVSFFFNPIEGRPDTFQLNADTYGGTLKIVSALNIKDELLPYKANIQLDRVNLSLLQKRIRTKTPDLAGTMDIWSEITGQFKNPDNLTGRGSLSITNGMLGKLIPQLEQSNFTGAKGDFTIKNRRLITNNLQTFSPTIDLKVQGWIDFNQNLDLMVYPNYEKLKALKEEKWEQLTAPLLKDMINIRVTGTWSDRKYSVKTTPGKILKKTSDILTEGVKGIGSVLENVLDQSNF